MRLAPTGASRLRSLLLPTIHEHGKRQRSLMQLSRSTCEKQSTLLAAADLSNVAEHRSGLLEPSSGDVRPKGSAKRTRSPRTSERPWLLAFHTADHDLILFHADYHWAMTSPV